MSSRLKNIGFDSGETLQKKTKIQILALKIEFLPLIARKFRLKLLSRVVINTDQKMWSSWKFYFKQRGQKSYQKVVVSFNSPKFTRFNSWLQPKLCNKHWKNKETCFTEVNSVHFTHKNQKIKVFRIVSQMNYANLETSFLEKLENLKLKT